VIIIERKNKKLTEIEAHSEGQGLQSSFFITKAAQK